MKAEVKEGISFQGDWTFIWTDEAGNELRRREEHNLVVNTGLYAIIGILAGEISQNCAIYCALGTGTTPAADTDETLGAEATRKILTTNTRNSAQWILRFYYLTGEAVGTYTELGVFLEGTAIADSGRLLNRVLPGGGISKATNENLIIEVKITATAA